LLPHTAEQVMTRRVITIRKGSPVEQALRLMSENHVSGLPVVDVDGRLVGMITESDLLLRGMPEESPGAAPLSGWVAQEPDRVTEVYRKGSARLVEEAMTSKVVFFAEDSSVADIARVMTERNINRVPIVKDGKVVGIVSRGDIIRSMAALEFDGEPGDSIPPEPPRIELL